MLFQTLIHYIFTVHQNKKDKLNFLNNMRKSYAEFKKKFRMFILCTQSHVFFYRKKEINWYALILPIAADIFPAEYITHSETCVKKTQDSYLC